MFGIEVSCLLVVAEAMPASVRGATTAQLPRWEWSGKQRDGCRQTSGFGVCRAFFPARRLPIDFWLWSVKGVFPSTLGTEDIWPLRRPCLRARLHRQDPLPQVAVAGSSARALALGLCSLAFLPACFLDSRRLAAFSFVAIGVNVFIFVRGLPSSFCLAR